MKTFDEWWEEFYSERTSNDSNLAARDKAYAEIAWRAAMRAVAAAMRAVKNEALDENE